MITCDGSISGHSVGLAHRSQNGQCVNCGQHVSYELSIEVWSQTGPEDWERDFIFLDKFPTFDAALDAAKKQNPWDRLYIDEMIDGAGQPVWKGRAKNGVVVTEPGMMSDMFLCQRRAEVN